MLRGCDAESKRGGVEMKYSECGMALHGMWISGHLGIWAGLGCALWKEQSSHDRRSA